MSKRSDTPLKELRVQCDISVTESYLQNKKQCDFLASFGLEPRVASEERSRLSQNLTSRPSLHHHHVYSLHGLLRPKGVYNQLDIPLCSDLNNDIVENRTHQRHFYSPPRQTPQFFVRPTITRVVNNINNAQRFQQIMAVRRARLIRNSVAYCFNGRQRRERFQVLRTGLNKRSRHLVRLVKPCSVMLEPLTSDKATKYLAHSSRHVCIQRLSKKRLQTARSNRTLVNGIKSKKSIQISHQSNLNGTKPIVRANTVPNYSKKGLPLSGQRFIRISISPSSKARANFNIARVSVERMIVARGNENTASRKTNDQISSPKHKKLIFSPKRKEQISTPNNSENGILPKSNQRFILPKCPDAIRKLDFNFINSESSQSCSFQSSPANSLTRSDFRHAKPSSQSVQQFGSLKITPPHLSRNRKAHSAKAFSSARPRLRTNNMTPTFLDDDEVSISPLMLTPEKPSEPSTEQINFYTDLSKKFDHLTIDTFLMESEKLSDGDDEEVSVSPEIVFPGKTRLPYDYFDACSNMSSSPPIPASTSDSSEGSNCVELCVSNHKRLLRRKSVS